MNASRLFQVICCLLKNGYRALQFSSNSGFAEKIKLCSHNRKIYKVKVLYVSKRNFIKKEAVPPDFSSLIMAGYRTAPAESIKSAEYRLACRCKIYSGNYYNLCRLKLSKIETNQKGFYSAGSFGGPCRHADLFHFVFQGCGVCRNTSGDPPRSVSLRCLLTWRFDLFRS